MYEGYKKGSLSSLNNSKVNADSNNNSQQMNLKVVSEDGTESKTTVAESKY